MCVCVLPSLLPSDRPAGDLHVLLHILISHQFTHKKNTQMQVNKQDTLRVVEPPSDRKSRPNVSNRSFFPVAL